MDIAELHADGIVAAGDVLAKALFDDGLARHMYPDERERRDLIPWHFRAAVRYGVLFGRTLTTAGEPRGVAVWLPPGETAMTEARIAAAGLDAAPAVLGEAAFGRFMTAMAHLEPFHAQDVQPQHWYLALIGVDPGQSGQGIGSALMQPVLAEADRDGLPCYLETAEESNVGFYEKHGFETIRSGTAPGTPVRYWTMLRSPR